MKKFPEWLTLIKGDIEKDDDEEVVMRLAEPIGFDLINGGMSAKAFGESLASVPSKKRVNLHINTLGGRIDEGMAMHNMLLARGNVTTTVIGYAASMGSVVAQAGARRVMMPGTMMIIHNPQLTADGDHNDMEKAGEFLRQVKKSIVDLYHNRTKSPKRELSDMMDEVTAMDPETAKKLGFCDDVADGSPAFNELKPAALGSFYSNLISTSNKIEIEPKPKQSMKKVIAALAALIKLPEDATDEIAAPQVQAAVSGVVVERDALKTENQSFRNALKLRVENRVQKAIDSKLLKAERKDALIAAGIANESALDFLDDISSPTAPAQRRAAPPVPAASGDIETLESLRAEMSTSTGDDDDTVERGKANARNARKLRELRGHKNLFETAKN